MTKPPAADRTPDAPARASVSTRPSNEGAVPRVPDLSQTWTGLERPRVERHLAGQYAVARALAESATLAKAGPRIVQAVCESLGWELGAIWRVDEPATVLDCMGVWHAPWIDASEFEAETHNPLAPGEGLPGVVWSTGEARWIDDFRAWGQSRRKRAAARAGLRTAFCVPVSLKERVLGVMEFFTQETRPPDEELLGMMTALGRQVGQFMERRLVEASLLETQQRVVNILQTMPAAFIAMDSGFNLTYANDTAERLMRRPREELIGRNVWEAFPEAVGTAFHAAGTTAMRERVPVEFEEYFTPFDSWFEVHAYPVEDGLSVYFRDITDRKRAELALRDSEARTTAILRSAMDCVVTMDQEGRITEFNPAAERTFGFARDDVIGKPLADTIVPPSLRDRHRLAVARYLETGVAHVIGRRLELAGRRADGTEFPVEVTITRVDGLAQPLFTGFIRDISERRQAEQERERLRSEAEVRAAEVERLNEELELRVAERTADLEASNRELEAFSYSVSHDLRAPLRAIDGFSRIVLKDHGAAMPEAARDYLEIVREGAQQMGRLIDDLLAFARLGRQSLVKRQVDPADVARRALGQLNAELEGRGVDVRIDQLPPCEADPSLLQQVYVNLLSNALKFTRTRSPAVIEVGSRELEGHRVYFVEDNGVGFDMRYADKLFGVFQRMHRSEEYEGTGVGLAIVQRIVHRHGGRVWAEAEPGAGATFLFSLEGEAADD